MNFAHGGVSLQSLGKPWVDGLVLAIRVIGRIVLLLLLGWVFLAIIAFTVMSAVFGGALGGRR